MIIFSTQVKSTTLLKLPVRLKCSVRGSQYPSLKLVPQSRVPVSCRLSSEHQDTPKRSHTVQLSKVASSKVPVFNAKGRKNLDIEQSSIDSSFRGLAFLVLLIAIHLAQPLAALASGSHATASIATSSLGLKVANSLRSLGIPDELVVFLLATLPVLELRGAIPVAYWMGLDPLKASVLAVLGNMVPVPFVLLFLGPVCDFLSKSSSLAKQAIDLLLEVTRRKAGPIEEFKWLGLMLFVAVPLPGTGAWSGAMGAYVLGMPFWSAFSANFVGVILAGFLVNTLCTLGLKSALLLGLGLFGASSVLWSVLRFLQGRSLPGV